MPMILLTETVPMAVEEQPASPKTPPRLDAFSSTAKLMLLHSPVPVCNVFDYFQRPVCNGLEDCIMATVN